MTDKQSLKAWLQGYVEFRVNGEPYLTYNGANAKVNATAGAVSFTGLHWLRGWEGFYIRTAENRWFGPAEEAIASSLGMTVAEVDDLYEQGKKL